MVVKHVYTAAHAGKLLAKEKEEQENRELRDIARERLKHKHKAIAVHLEEENESLRTMLKRMKERLEAEYETIDSPKLIDSGYVHKLQSDINLLKRVLGEE